MQRNQSRLQELHSDFKEVSKLNDEPYVNVRKIKGPVKKPTRGSALPAGVDMPAGEEEDV